MTAKLRIELENKTGKGFDEIVKDVERMGAKGKDTQKALEKLNAEMDSRKATELAEQVKDLADEYDGAAAATRKANDAMTASHIDVPGGDVQQSLGDDRKPRGNWNKQSEDFTDDELGTEESKNAFDQEEGRRGGRWVLDAKNPLVDEKDKRGNPILTTSEEGQKILRQRESEQRKKRQDAESGRKQAEADPYKNIMDLNKQEEEQKRKQEAAEQTRKQAEKDKSENLPELTTKAEEESKKLADIQKQKEDELKKIKEFEEKRRQASSERTKDAKAKNDGDFKKHKDEQEFNRIRQEEHDAADAGMRWDDAEWGGDGTGLDLWTSDEDRAKQAKAKADATKQKRDRERKFSPDYGPETPRDRAEARRKAAARARGAERKSKAQTKAKTNQRGRRGEIKGPETTRAYHDLVQQQVQQLRNQGNLDQTQINAIEQLLQATRDSSMQQAEMQEKMDQLLQQILELRGFRPSKGNRQAAR